MCERLFDPVAEAATRAVAEAAAELVDVEDNIVWEEAEVVVGIRLVDVTLERDEDVLEVADVTALMILDALCVELVDVFVSDEVVALVVVVRDDEVLDVVRLADDREDEEEDELASSSSAIETTWPKRGATDDVVAVGLLTAGTVTVVVTLATAGLLLPHESRASKPSVLAATASEAFADDVC